MLSSLDRVAAQVTKSKLQFCLLDEVVEESKMTSIFLLKSQRKRRIQIDSNSQRLMTDLERPLKCQNPILKLNLGDEGSFLICYVYDHACMYVYIDFIVWFID